MEKVAKTNRQEPIRAITNILPDSGLVRVSQILGDKKKGIPPIVPVSRSNWWAGVRAGRYPAGRKLSERITVWDAAQIRALIGKAD